MISSLPARVDDHDHSTSSSRSRFQTRMPRPRQCPRNSISESESVLLCLQDVPTTVYCRMPRLAVHWYTQAGFKMHFKLAKIQVLRPGRRRGRREAIIPVDPAWPGPVANVPIQQISAAGPTVRPLWSWPGRFSYE